MRLLYDGYTAWYAILVLFDIHMLQSMLVRKVEQSASIPPFLFLSLYIVWIYLLICPCLLFIFI